MGIFVFHAADGLGHFVAVAGVGGGGVHPAAQGEVARTAAGVQLFGVELIAAGGQNHALGRQILHIAIRRFDDGTCNLIVFLEELHDGCFEQYRYARFLQALLHGGGDVRGGHGEIDRGVPAAADAEFIIRSIEFRKITGTEGQGIFAVLAPELIKNQSTASSQESIHVW